MKMILSECGYCLEMAMMRWSLTFDAMLERLSGECGGE